MGLKLFYTSEMDTKNAEQDWQVGKSLGDRLYHMLQNEVDCDVTFVFPNSEPPARISAHKLVLKAGSPVFDAMLSGNFREASSDVEIVDIDPTVFEELLRFLYSDNAEVNAENANPLMFAAEKYIVDGLAQTCTDFLCTKMNENNVCMLLNDSLEYGNNTLLKTCLDFIGVDTEKVLSTSGFVNLSCEALRLIVEANHLYIKDELALYEACVNWAQHQSGSQSDGELRQTLKDTLFEIRFHQMTPTDFASSVAIRDILTEREENHIFRYIIRKDANSRDVLESCGFNMSTRGKNPVFTVSCSESPGVVLYGTTHQSETLNIKYPSGPVIMLEAIFVYGGKLAGECHDITIHIQASHSFLCHFEGKIESTGEKHPIRVDIHERRVLLNPRQKFQIALNTRGPPGYFQKGPRDHFMIGNMDFSFSTNSEMKKMRIAKLVFARI